MEDLLPPSSMDPIAVAEKLVSKIVGHIVSFALITLPSTVIALITRALSWSLVLTFDYRGVILLLLILLITTYAIVYRVYLTNYSRLPPPAPGGMPKSKGASYDLHPDATGTSSDREDRAARGYGGFNYAEDFLGSFLQSIKVFGFMEPPVFHELARRLQTRKLPAGDILFSADVPGETNFYIVVDGCVHVFVKNSAGHELHASSVHTFSSSNTNPVIPQNLNTHSNPTSSNYANDSHLSYSSYAPPIIPSDEPLPGHTLLNEVHQGGTVSSLFSILSLLSQTLGANSNSASEFNIAQESPLSQSLINPESMVSTESRSSHSSTSENAPLHPSSVPKHSSKPSLRQHPLAHSHTLDPHSGLNGLGLSEQDGNDSDVFPQLSPDHLRSTSNHQTFFSGTSRGSALPSQHQTIPSMHHPLQFHQDDVLDTGMSARAAQDTTLLVIPAEAFVRLLDKYPHAAAHIAQVILTRFQRVTCAALAQYLGMPAAILAIDQQLHEFAAGYGPKPGLPAGLFRPGGLERLRRKFHMTHSVFRSHIRPMNQDSEPDTSISNTSIFSTPPTPTLSRMPRKSAMLDARRLTALNNSSLHTVSAPHTETANTPLSGSSVSGSSYGLLHDAVARAAALNAATTPLSRKIRAIATSINNLAGTPLSATVVPSGNKQPAQTDSETTVLGIDTRAFDDSEEELQLRNIVFAAMLHAIGLRDAATRVLADSTIDDESKAPDAFVPPPSPFGSFSGLYGGVSVTSAVSEVDMSDIEIRFYKKGDALIKPGQPMDGLFYVVDGLLSVSVGNRTQSGLSSSAARQSSTTGPLLAVKKQIESGHRVLTQHQYFVRPGNISGYMPALTGHASLLLLEARTDLCVAFMPKNAIDRLVDRQPTVILTLAHRLVSVLNPLVLHIDFALEWMQVNAGQVLYRQGDPSSAIYMVLNGRLRAIQENTISGTFGVVSEHGQGESVGEQEVLMGTPRPHTTHAIRDTELAQMPHTLFEALALRHPEITLAMARIIAGRSQRCEQTSGNAGLTRFPAGLPIGGLGNGQDLGKNNANLRTVAVLPVHGALPVVEFAGKLHAALVQTLEESALLLTQASVLSVLGKHAFTRIGKLKLMSWLSEQETRHRIVLYVADGGVMSPWTQRCIRQADCILLVASADQDPGVGEHERYMLGVKTTARKELVLLHPNRSCAHGITRKWLNNRLWIHGHHHVAMAVDSSSNLYKPSAPHLNKTNSHVVQSPHQVRNSTYGSPVFEDLGFADAIDHLKGTLRHYYSQYTTPLMGKFRSLGVRAVNHSSSIGPRSDFARLARRLCGRSIGLVLGGGGARGISHLGVIRALEEAGVPIDMVGGTSIGAMVGGLYARDVDHVSVLGRLKAFSSRMSSVWRTMVDLTYPVTSYLTGHQFNRGVWKAFGDIHVEDLWLSYFCITTNIVDSRMEVHQSGYLWRYVRASMSLSGFIPPLSDGGILLVDGGYLNNLPGDVMKGFGADLVIMVDVACDDDTSKVFIDDSVSGLSVMINRWNPFRVGKAIPTLADIQSKLAYVSCIRQLEEAKQLPGCFYLRPPVAQYSTFDFKRFDIIYKDGYEYMQQVLTEWEKQGILKLFVPHIGNRYVRTAPQARRSSI